jgi:dynactin-4
MMVTYTYSSDESASPKAASKRDDQATTSDSEVKSFSFWTMLSLGTVLPRAEETRRRLAASGA